MIKNFTTIFATIFILLGFFGFISNPLIGANALFATNGASNWLHLIAGIALFLIGRYAR